MLALKPHPDFPSSAVTAIAVAVERSGARLSLRYTAEGALDRVRWPERMQPARTDGLWQHTCFEAFIQPVGSAVYTEINLSPSGQWAAYEFDGRRSGMRDAAAIPALEWASPVLAASIVLEGAEAVDWRLGLTAVIEAIDGTKSYWALAHGDGPPDFHNPDCFIAALPAPTGS